MSLYFNWSCDFQRFTKSKKLSKFQVRTTTLFISNKILSTSLFNLQGTICCFQAFFRNFSKFRTAFQQLIYYIRLFFICQELFQNFFRSFWSRSFKIQTFWPPSLSKQLIYYIKPKSVCQELFSFFSNRFSARPPCLSATALIEYQIPDQMSSTFFKLLRFF